MQLNRYLTSHALVDIDGNSVQAPAVAAVQSLLDSLAGRVAAPILEDIAHTNREWEWENAIDHLADVLDVNGVALHPEERAVFRLVLESMDKTVDEYAFLDLQTHMCPVCGYTGLQESPRTESGGGSYEICWSCGFEYGVTDDDERYSYEAWRRLWIQRGMPFSSSDLRPPPADWDPKRQLAALLKSASQYQRVLPDPAPVDRLRAAGCVFAEGEAALLRLEARSNADLERMTAARESGEPLEYIVGFVEFCGAHVNLDRGVFIPRRRSEFLVRTAAALAPSDATVLDLCCGSGALGKAFGSLVPGAEVHAADIDPAAVRNARRNLPRVYESDLFDNVSHREFDVVLANVPYVPSDQLDTMPIEAREHEPARTHDGGEDGLDVLRRALQQAATSLTPGGHILFEIADSQRAAVLAIPTELHVECRYSDEYDATIAIATRPR